LWSEAKKAISEETGVAGVAGVAGVQEFRSSGVQEHPTGVKI
jgi:hypothetical protein